MRINAFIFFIIYVFSPIFAFANTENAAALMRIFNNFISLTFLLILIYPLLFTSKYKIIIFIAYLFIALSFSPTFIFLQHLRIFEKISGKFIHILSSISSLVINLLMMNSIFAYYNKIYGFFIFYFIWLILICFLSIVFFSRLWFKKNKGAWRDNFKKSILKYLIATALLGVIFYLLAGQVYSRSITYQRYLCCEARNNSQGDGGEPILCHNIDYVQFHANCKLFYGISNDLIIFLLIAFALSPIFTKLIINKKKDIRCDIKKE